MSAKQTEDTGKKPDAEPTPTEKLSGLSLGDGGAGEEDDDEGEGKDGGGEEQMSKSKKKRNRQKKKKEQQQAQGGEENGSGDKSPQKVTPVKNGPADGGKKKGKGGGGVQQTSPKPTIPIDELYPEKNYPVGQIMEHGKLKNQKLEENQEKKMMEKLNEDTYQDIRRAAEAHRQTRKYIRDYIKPGMSMTQICEELEGTARRLINEQGLSAGLAFPTGCSLNHVAAHYTPNAGDTTCIGVDDVCKIDFGTHVNGEWRF